MGEASYSYVQHIEVTLSKAQEPLQLISGTKIERTTPLEPLIER